MKLQKLLYFAHGWHLALTSKPLISETIQAWNYGPVVESLYHDLKGYGYGAVTRPISDLVLGEGAGFSFQFVEPRVEDPDIKAFLGKILDAYGALSAIQLSNLTHLPDAPWAIVKEAAGGQIERSLTIPDELIASCFNKAQAKQ